MTSEHSPEPPLGPRKRRSPLAFVRSRWHGTVPVAQVFWKDMIVHGTTINIVAGALGLALLAYGAPTALGVVVFFAPLPYNVFIFAALFRAAVRLDEPWTTAARAVALLWLLVVTII